MSKGKQAGTKTKRLSFPEKIELKERAFGGRPSSHTRAGIDRGKTGLAMTKGTRGAITIGGALRGEGNSPRWGREELRRKSFFFQRRKKCRAARERDAGALKKKKKN